MEIDIKKMDNLEIDWNGKPDYPEFCNAFISHFDYDGEPATDEQLDFVNDNLLENFYEEIYESLI